MARIGFKLKRLARYIGLYKRKITMPDGVRYRERSGVSIRRALSEHGSGVKEYDVRFPLVDSEGRRGMRIRYTATRLFGDVGHDPRSVLYAQILDRITPGQRVLEIGCGTGAGSAMLAQAVGPSGGVVAIDRDGESIRFARQRHRSDHCGFENGWIDTLDGETNGGFDAVVAVDPLQGQSEEARPVGGSGGWSAISEIVRVIAPGGTLVVISSQADGLVGFKRVLEEVIKAGMEHVFDLEPCHRTGWFGIVCAKPGSAKPQMNLDHQSPGSFQS